MYNSSEIEQDNNKLENRRIGKMKHKKALTIYRKIKLTNDIITIVINCITLLMLWREWYRNKT